MFLNNPLGCGHRCTATLSPYYLDEEDLIGTDENRARSSHNTIMTLLVEQGIPGVAFYAALLIWLVTTAAKIRRLMSGSKSFSATALAAVAASLVAITIGDLFVDYLKFEIRIWFLALLSLLLCRSSRLESAEVSVGLKGAAS
jgi:O-antigen ligase